MGFIGVSQLLLNHTPISVSLFQESARFFKCILICIASTICSNEVILSNSLSPVFFFKSDLDISKTLVNKLNILLALCICSVGMLQSNSKIKNISFKFLFHSKSLNLSFCFCLQCHLHSFKGFTKVFLG